MSKSNKYFNWGACMFCELVGGFIGYCVSFFFQNELIREKIGFSGYVRSIVNILFPGKSMMPHEVCFIAWGGFFIGALLFSIGYRMQCRAKQKADERLAEHDGGNDREP